MGTTKTTVKLDAFTLGYVRCALWLCDENPGSGEWSEHGYFTMENIAQKTLAKMAADCERFQEENAGELEEARAYCHYEDGRAGQDFWLSRNGHGAGFFDRGNEAVWDRLQEAARAYGEFNVDRTGRGKIHGYPL